MKFIKILIIFFSLYFLVLLQTSFFVHFGAAVLIPNLIFIAVLFLSFFENILVSKQEFYSFWAAIAGGFFLDVFSSQFIGFHILILLGIVIFIKAIFKRYVRIPV